MSNLRFHKEKLVVNMSLLNQSYKENRCSKRLQTATPRDTDFSKVGGLDHHLCTLREIIIFPLLHSNVFTHFKIKPVKGVLFHGPPGTGKTLVAGALATEINKEGLGKVSFFQRKGGDILDKWVGGSEKNLTAVFEQATKSRPSIIFFDEIDGLAPVRSDRNDQVHASIVATLLALMDGLDSKPGVIVIGATNRIEAVDPALRRSGRFDRELYFPLPTFEARKEILEVHTSSWKHKPSSKFLVRLADLTTGFCGSDLQALCSEAVMCCARRLYPSINLKGCCNVNIKVESLKIEENDFTNARLNLSPCNFKSGFNVRELSHVVKPLLQRQRDKILKYIKMLWPHFLIENYKYEYGEKRYAGRVLLIGNNAQGLHTHLVPSVLKHLEHVPILFYDSRFIDRIKLNFDLMHPCVVVLSRVDEWWNFIDDNDQHSIVTALEDVHAELPVLILATSRNEIPLPAIAKLFYNNNTVLIKIEDPNEEEKQSFFAPLFFNEKGLSLLSIWQNYTKLNLIEGNDNDDLISCYSRKRARTCDLSDEDDVTFKRKKRNKSAFNLDKKIKFYENKYGPYRSSSTGSLYDIRKNMKEENVCRECGSFTSALSMQKDNQRQYFTRVLSDLLNQRSVLHYTKSNSSNNLDMILTNDLNLNEFPLIHCFSKKNIERTKSQKYVNKKQIYTLWKHASLITSKGMPLALLELLYDVITTCLNLHKNSFVDVTEHLDSVLKRIEEQYHIGTV